MRKFAAILFFNVLFFNWFGYRLVFGYFETEHTHQLAVKLDNKQYDESDLISVKIPYPLPYASNSSDFERWDGEVNIDGVLHQYVKRRIVSDSIEFLCIPDRKSMQLQTARDNFFRLANDLQQDQPTKKSDQSNVPSFKSVMSEYCDEVQEWNIAVTTSSPLYQPFYASFYIDFLGNTTEQPPDIC